MRQRVRGVLFDLDNTLADRDAAYFAWAHWFVRERLQIMEPEAMQGAVEDLATLDSGGRRAKDVVFGTLKERYPQLVDSVEDLVTEFREQMISRLPPLDPAAARLLDALDEATLPWGIVSNGSASQLRKVCALGLDGRAACVVISEIVGARKPAPEIFLHAAQALNVPTGDVLFVGDHPEADVLGARGAGMQTAWLRHGRTWSAALHGREPEYSVDSLDELSWVAWEAAGCPDHVTEKSAP